MAESRLLSRELFTQSARHALVAMGFDANLRSHFETFAIWKMKLGVLSGEKWMVAIGNIMLEFTFGETSDGWQVMARYTQPFATAHFFGGNFRQPERAGDVVSE
jgi:hypothetical protein